MELNKEAEKNVIAKPVASRPSTSSCSNFRFFSELLAGTINVSPSYETAVTAIRPKTIMFKPPPLEAEITNSLAFHSSDKVSKSSSKSTLVYKPLAKMVSRTTVSLLANMGNSVTTHQQALAQVEAHAQTSNQLNHHLIYNHSPNPYQKFSPQAETNHKTSDPLKLAPDNMENDKKSQPHTSISADRPSYDGYNWRKYGQKQVKGSEYPRSYYKCTHPNCPVKKKVERSIDGEIAEIVYEGEHNHSKPSQLPRRNNGTGQDLNSRLPNNQVNDRNEGFEGSMENQVNEILGSSSLLTNLGKAPISYDSCGVNGVREEGSKVMEAEDDEPKSKRRKNVNQSNEAVTYGEGVPEPRIVVQSATDSEIIADGFRWRKYGQKVVKGNPYPRSYYRCTGLKCNVRKHVERASDDPNAFITTYEGKHNHDIPIKTTNGMTSELELKNMN